MTSIVGVDHRPARQTVVGRHTAARQVKVPLIQLPIKYHFMNQATKPPKLDGITLEMIVTRLSVTIGWEEMSAAVPVRCFTHDPSIKSSLKFLRRTPWARERVEQLYLQVEQQNAEPRS